MRRDFTQLTAFALLAVSMSVSAQKATIYSDQSITIYADNTVVSTKTGRPLVFSESKTWVEEDYFTQQEKYCEVDSIHKDKFNKFLKKISKPSK